MGRITNETGMSFCPACEHVHRVMEQFSHLKPEEFPGPSHKHNILISGEALMAVLAEAWREGYDTKDADVKDMLDRDRSEPENPYR